MALLTAEQAGLRLNRTERTIRRWIEEEKLKPAQTSYGRKKKYLVEESEVERLAQELAQVEQPAEQGLAIEDMASLVERITQLEIRIATLEQLVSEASLGSLQRATAPFKRLGRPVTTTPAQPPVDIPRGSLLMKDFAELHNVNRRTFEDHIKKGLAGEQVEALAFTNPKRADEVKRWLTPEQQRAAIAFWQRHAVTFTPCARCPHESESEDSQEDTTLWHEQETASSETVE